MHDLRLSLPPNFYVGTKTEMVVETIRTAILTGDVPPGAKITEQKVKDALNVSSSPVREAFHHLEAEGLLTRTPHTGTTVTAMDVEDAKELYKIQSLLQGVAVQISCGKLSAADIAEAEGLNAQMKKMARRKIDVKRMRVINYKFHMLICGINIYPWLTRVISALWIRLPTQSVWLMPERPALIVNEHEKILNAVKQKEGSVAGALISRHLDNSLQALFGKSNPRPIKIDS